MRGVDRVPLLRRVLIEWGAPDRLEVRRGTPSANTEKKITTAVVEFPSLTAPLAPPAFACAERTPPLSALAVGFGLADAVGAPFYTC
jgi:hypothetical protein